MFKPFGGDGVLTGARNRSKAECSSFIRCSGSRRVGYTAHVFAMTQLSTLSASSPNPEANSCDLGRVT